MYTNELRSKIEIDQRRQLNNLVFVLIVVLFSVITSAVAPQLMYEYVLQGVSVDQQLLVLQYIPVVAYVLSLIAFVMAAVGYFNHRRRTNMYEQEMMLLEYSEDDCNCGDPSHHHGMDHMDHMDAMHDHDDEEMMMESTPVSSSVADLSAALSKADSSARGTSTRKKGRSTTKKSSKK